MHALSIRQPWAWAILHAHKDIENRDWSTHYRGPFYIHAARSMSHTEYDDFVETYLRCIRATRPNLPLPPKREDLQFGGIVGKAEIVDCVRTHSSPWFEGKYGFVLSGVKPVPFRSLRGSLGFFRVDPEVLK